VVTAQAIFLLKRRHRDKSIKQTNKQTDRQTNATKHPTPRRWLYSRRG